MNKIIKTKIRNDWISKIILFVFSSLSIVALLVMFVYILREAIPAYKEYGFFHMYFTSDFTQKGGYGIWGALSLTLITSILATIIATPLALRAAIFMKFRMRNREKLLKMFINISAGIPSVVFGIFALKSLSGFSGLFGQDNSHTILNATFMLTMMIFPTMVSLIYNQMTLIDKSLIYAPMALGETKTGSIYKVVKRSIKPQIYVAVIIALGRAIGETMALSMVLTAPSHSIPYSGSFSDFFASPFSTLGVEIARQMFIDGANPQTRSALFAAGVAIFIIIMILIAFINKLSTKMKLSSENPLNYKKLFKTQHEFLFINYINIFIHTILLPFKLIGWIIFFITKYISKYWVMLADYLSIPIYKFFFTKRLKGQSNSEYFISNKRSWKIYIRDGIRHFLEYISIIIIVGSIAWILLSVLIFGLPEIHSNDWKFQYKNQFGKVVGGDIMNPLIWTILLIMLTILITIPFALATAIYLSEYAKNKKSGKVIKFFLDSLGGTPSILFGIFGAVFFLRTLGLSSTTGGTSLIAGSLTMVLVIFPTFTRSIEQILIKIPDSWRYASYSLGASKFETIKKIIIPHSIKGISTGIVLSSGRILAETAPVYLTLGMFNGINLGFLEAGHTLTTDILYNQVFAAGNADELLKHSYKLASIAIILITFISLLTEVINSKDRRNKNGKKFKKFYYQRFKSMIPKWSKTSTVQR